MRQQAFLLLRERHEPHRVAIVGVDVQGLLALCDRVGQMSARLRVAWSQLYAASAHRFGVRPVPVIENMNGRQCVLRGRNTFVQLQRLERAASGFGEEIGAGAKPEQPLIKIRPRKVRVSLGR